MRYLSRVIGSLLAVCLLFCIVVHFSSCATRPHPGFAVADSLNQRSYALRYENIDSSLILAKKAYTLSDGYPEGRAFAMNNLAFVLYQQMRYGTAIEYLDKSYRTSRSQIELLCADVMYMKVAQRTGQGQLFFKHRNSAIKRINRLMEEESLLTDLQRSRLVYARSELHIVSSTYYYYYGQTEKAISEIKETALDPALQKDTAQWLYYRYMLGSGGLIKGTPQEVALQEFDHLFATYTLAHTSGKVYFLANALQSIASLLDNREMNAYIVENRSNAIAFLRNQHSSWHQLPDIESYATLSLIMADRAVHLFRVYKDLFQLACAYRTVGEIYFRHGMYNYALRQFEHALKLVDSQKQRSTWQVPFWTFSIREYLSLTYSALGDKQNSDRHRNAYLDCLEQFRQDDELEDRKSQLESELHSSRVSLFFLIVLIVLIVILLLLLVFRMRSQSRNVSTAIDNIKESEQWLCFNKTADEVDAELEDKQQQLDELIQLHGRHIHDYRYGNVERRAKVALVYAIIPYLDRIIAEVNRMQKSGSIDDARLQYVSELSSEIMKVNDVLTDWIQMRQGQFNLHITTFFLRDVFEIISGGKMLFEKKGIKLKVEPTACKVKADMALTLFMINTLCDNARKFTPSGGEVSLTATPFDEYTEISVSDTGVGLSEQDVHVLNQSKIYDPAQLGEKNADKGFGFGLMNCKGIIAKYKKTSKKFHLCEFGVESRKGQGSRFWFRLPTALSVLLLFASSLLAHTNENPFKAVSDSVCQANIDGHYQDGYDYGMAFLSNVPLPVDTPSVINILNEMAVASLSLKQWENYYLCNKECVRLHNLYTSDDTLPAYCQQMERMNNNSVLIYALLVCALFFTLLLFYLLLLRGRVRRDSYAQTLYQWLLHSFRQAEETMDKYKTHDGKPNWQALLAHKPEGFENLSDSMKNVSTDCMQTMHNRFNRADQAVDRNDDLSVHCHRLQFEEERLYVMNQVLDNCLSTIKHETMYYPARTQQLVEFMRQSDNHTENIENLHELSDLVQFYHRIYTLLYQQASRQVEQNNFYREKILLSDLDNRLPSIYVMGDNMLVKMLLHTLSEAEPFVVPVLSASVQPPFAFVRFTYPDVHRNEKELENMFQPLSHHIPLLIAKQIIREHDAYSGHVGLRLNAEGVQDGYCIQFTLLLAN